MTSPSTNTNLQRSSSARLWSRTDPLAYGLGLASFATVAAPLLAGFSLSAIIALTGRSQIGVSGNLAITALALAASLLLYSVQAGLTAQQHSMAPDQRAAQIPEA